jgi:hypothetical protein
LTRDGLRPVVGSKVGVLFFFGFLLCGLAKRIEIFEKESPEQATLLNTQYSTLQREL